MPLRTRRYLVFLLDLIFIVSAYLLAYLLLFNFKIDRQTDLMTKILPIVIVCKVIVFLSSRLYRSMWKYASLPDAFEIFKTVSLSSVMSLVAILMLRQYEHFSRTIFI